MQQALVHCEPDTTVSCWEGDRWLVVIVLNFLSIAVGGALPLVVHCFCVTLAYAGWLHCFCVTLADCRTAILRIVEHAVVHRQFHSTVCVNASPAVCKVCTT
jgi:hypothetical protein